MIANFEQLLPENEKKMGSGISNKTFSSESISNKKSFVNPPNGKVQKFNNGKTKYALVFFPLYKDKLTLKVNFSHRISA